VSSSASAIATICSAEAGRAGIPAILNGHFTDDMARKSDVLSIPIRFTFKISEKVSCRNLRTSLYSQQN
jgi:hypothetical protein